LRYGQFRCDRQAEGRWYRSDAKFGRDIGPFELDAILLAMLRTTGSILRDRRAMAEIDSPTAASTSCGSRKATASPPWPPR
jgi:hypothetical protein